MGDLDRRSAVVTGGAAGIGKVIAECLSAAGARVAIADIDEARALATAAALPGEAIAVVHDVRKADSAAALAKRVTAELDGLDILVNNAGVGPRPTPFQDLTEAEWDRCMDVNARGVFLTSRALIPLLIGSEHGRIVNISSTVGQTGFGLIAPYAASKFAVTGLSQCLAHELAPHGVTVNSVHPGIVGAGMREEFVALYSQARGESERAIWDSWKSQIPLGRLQTPRDVAEMVAFLASDRARNVTGAAFNVDGGTEMH